MVLTVVQVVSYLVDMLFPPTALDLLYSYG